MNLPRIAALVFGFGAAIAADAVMALRYVEGGEATGVTWLGGNERYDPRWMWDRE